MFFTLLFTYNGVKGLEAAYMSRELESPRLCAITGWEEVEGRGIS